jgi:hypothetical protein
VQTRPSRSSSPPHPPPKSRICESLAPPAHCGLCPGAPPRAGHGHGRWQNRRQFLWSAARGGHRDHGYLYGPYSFVLYVESSSDQKGSILSARVQATPKTTARTSALGTLTGKKVQLDLADPLTAEVHGDTVVGHFSKGAPATYIKR